MGKFSIHHITFHWSFNGFMLGIRFHSSACTSTSLGFLVINFWHEHTIVSKYPYRVLNPRVEAINSIIEEADKKISSLFDDGFSEFGGWQVEYVDKMDENSAHINLNCNISIERPVTEVLIQESVDRAEREYQENLKIWNNLPWYVKLFPQLSKDVYNG